MDNIYVFEGRLIGAFPSAIIFPDDPCAHCHEDSCHGCPEKDPCTDCDGKHESSCCGASLNGDICTLCGEHSENQCGDCKVLNPNI